MVFSITRLGLGVVGGQFGRDQQQGPKKATTSYGFYSLRYRESPKHQEMNDSAPGIATMLFGQM